MSAILLPFAPDGAIDWPAFERHVVRTADAGLTPAVNMDTGYVNLLDDAARVQVLRRRPGEALAGRPFVAGAFVADRPGAAFDRDAYLRADRADPGARRHAGHLPVVRADRARRTTTSSPPTPRSAGTATGSSRFELGTMFAPFGRIYSLEVYRGLLGDPGSASGPSIRRCAATLEWQRLALRDAVRPDFRVFTGNDLAIDMVMYGSDYLLGLSTFAPDLFARRDALLGGRRSGFLRAERRAAVPRLLRLPRRRCRPTSTRRRCSSSCAAGSAATPRTRAARRGRRAIATSSARSASDSSLDPERVSR